MRLRPRRGNVVVVWSSSAAPHGSGAWRRSARPRRMRRCLRIGVLLALIGVMRLARGTRAHWEPVLVGTGVVLAVIGYAVPAAFVAFLIGLVIMVVALLTGIAAKGRSVGQAADCWRWH